MDSSISDDIRESVRNGLSLECDAKLLQYMELIANKLNNRVKTTSNNLDALCSELQRTSISLDNATNRLSTLSHTKFVENRVYEDDETIANIKEVPVEIKTKEYNPIKTLNTVIKNNMKMLDNCYEKVSVELDDSDEEDEQIKSIVFRPKNNFETLPVPHLIGSKEWKEKWHIGIHDSDESFSENDNEEFSDGSDSLSLPSNGPTVSQSGSSVRSINRKSKFNVRNKSNDYTSSDEEISTTSKTSSNETEQRHLKNLPQIPPMHEQRYYVHQPKEKGLFDESSESENEMNKIDVKENQNLKENTVEPIRNKQQKQQIASNILYDEPPDLDVVVEQRNKLPSKLFFDSDEGELFNKNEHTIKNSAQIPVPKSDNVRKKTVNLFDDDDFNSFMEELDKKTIEKIPKAEPKNINLFENKDEIKPKKIIPQDLRKNVDHNDEVIKSIENIPVPVEKNILNDKPTTSKINSNIFNSSHKNIVENLPDSKKVESNLRISLFEDEDDLFSPTIIPIKKILENPTLDNAISKTKITNLFDDSLPDDEFDNLFKTSNTTSENLLNTEKKSDSNNAINTENLKSLINPPKSKSSISLLKNIFNDDIEDEDENIFKNQTNNTKNTFNTPKISTTNVEKISEIPSKYENPNNADEKGSEKNMLHSLNNEEISNNLISPMKNIFSNDAEDKITNISKNNIDVIKNTDANTEILPKQSMKYESIFNNENSISSSLFSDVAEDDDDFFKSLVNTKKNNKTAEESTKIIKNEKEILDSKLLITKTIANKNNLYDFPLNDNENSNIINILDEQSSIKTTNKVELPNLFSDEPPPDVTENLFIFNDMDKISIENSNNNNASLESLEQNTKILIDEVNAAGIDNTPVNELLKNNPIVHNEYKEEISNDIEKNQENENIMKTNDNQAEYNSNIIDETANINNTLSTPYLHSVFIPTIFDEIPPDDNDDIFSSLTKNNSHETEIFEASADNFIYSKTQKSPSVSNYDSVVFEDTIPPDDNNEENPSIFSQKNADLTKTSIQSIIVDNTFSDTTTTNRKTQVNTNFIFDDEPPTDSFIYNEENNGDKKVDIKQLELVEEKSLSVSDLIKKTYTVGIYSDTGILNATPSLEPKKLSTNLNINVAALIPGAKRPIMSTINKDESDGSISTKIQPSNSEAELNIDLNGKSIEKKQSAKQVTEEEFQQNILISLNKNRATIPKRKRPSTKHGRLENYRKSLADSETEKNTEEIDNLHKNIDLINENKARNIENVEEAIKNNSFKKSECLFSDKIDNDDSSLTTNSINKEEFSNKLPYKFENNLQPNKVNLNNQLNSINQSDVQSTRNSIFPITGNNDDDDWLFKTTSKSTEENIVASVVTKPRTEKNSDPFFFDDDSDLFSENSMKTITKSEIHHKNTTDKIKKQNEQLPNQNEQGIFQKIKIYKKKPIKKELISVDETIPKFTKPIDKLKNKSIGLLFDSDDDDDLFGSNSATKKLSINKNTPSIESNKKSLNVPKRNNLFNDTDDDDDDIFETKSVKAQSTVTKKTIEKPKINQSQGQSGGYNPLADLLNEK